MKSCTWDDITKEPTTGWAAALLGVFVANRQNMSQQCTAAATRATWTLDCICMGITNRDRDLIIPLYSALVKLHLEYCVQFWSPQFKKDVDRLRRSKKWVMKVIKGLKNLPYKERLKELGHFSLEKAQGDLITLFQYLKGGYKVDRGSLFTKIHMEKKRGNRQKLH